MVDVGEICAFSTASLDRHRIVGPIAHQDVKLCALLETNSVYDRDRATLDVYTSSTILKVTPYYSLLKRVEIFCYQPAKRMISEKTICNQVFRTHEARIANPKPNIGGLEIDIRKRVRLKRQAVPIKVKIETHAICARCN